MTSHGFSASFFAMTAGSSGVVPVTSWVCPGVAGSFSEFPPSAPHAATPRAVAQRITQRPIMLLPTYAHPGPAPLRTAPDVLNEDHPARIQSGYRRIHLLGSSRLRGRHVVRSRAPF